VGRPGGRDTGGFRPETGFIPYRRQGYDEGLRLYILGLGPPTYPLPAESDRAYRAIYQFMACDGSGWCKRVVGGVGPEFFDYRTAALDIPTDRRFLRAGTALLASKVGGKPTMQGDSVGRITQARHHRVPGPG
jgi:hypothetical protein